MKKAKKFEELTLEERNEVKELFTNWLRMYSHECILRAMEKAEDIINNDFAMNLLRELKTREEKEKEDFSRNIDMLFRDFNSFKEYDPHNHPLEHASSYRDVLRDMYL